MTKTPKKVCTCFGDTVFQSSTYIDAADVERCDLCGMPCREQPGDAERRRRRRGVARGLAIAAASSLATWLLTRPSPSSPHPEHE